MTDKKLPTITQAKKALADAEKAHAAVEAQRDESLTNLTRARTVLADVEIAASKK